MEHIVPKALLLVGKNITIPKACILGFDPYFVPQMWCKDKSFKNNETLVSPFILSYVSGRMTLPTLAIISVIVQKT